MPGPFLGHLTAPSSGISFTVLCAQDFFDMRGLRGHGLLQHVARMWCWQCCPLGGRPWPCSILGGVGDLAKGWLQAQATTVVLGLSEGGEGAQVSGVPNCARTLLCTAVTARQGLPRDHASYCGRPLRLPACRQGAAWLLPLPLTASRAPA